MSYVGYARIPTERDDQSLWQLLNQHKQSGDFYFLRWLHRVSGIITQLPAQLSPEGQLFNATYELRWKKRHQHYEVLWLGQQPPPDSQTFRAIAGEWETEDHPALLHDRKTPQYPNLFHYPSQLNARIGQRYFRDARTDIIHFIALTVSDPKPSAAIPTQA